MPQASVAPKRSSWAHGDRLYHWVEDRRLPADNHLAERDLRPTVIARKVSFGSPSEAGAQTRGVLISVRHTLKKRRVDVAAHLKGALINSLWTSVKIPFPALPRSAHLSLHSYEPTAEAEVEVRSDDASGIGTATVEWAAMGLGLSG